MSHVAIVIPARWGSSRFPGKPLHKIAGVPMVERVTRIAQAVKVEGATISAVVATDDERIAAHVQSVGGTAIMTPPECANGTERVWAAVQAMSQNPDLIINLQGDAVLTPPWTIAALIEQMLQKPEFPVGTIATQMGEEALAKLKEAKAAGEVSGTTVTMSQSGRALYFSKTIIPFIRKPFSPTFRHIGLYAYRYEALKTYMGWPATPLEKTEELEQLRFLENDVPMQVVTVDYQGRTHWGVDSEADAKRAEALILAEGELI